MTCREAKTQHIESGDTLSKPSRRAFLGQLGSAAIVIPQLRFAPFRSGSEPTPSASLQTSASSASYDLLIAGGRVIDPSQKLSAERDVAISNGKIARVASNIPHNQARKVFDAQGKIVTPGLIDIHNHLYKYGNNISSDSDRVGIQSGVTTLVDAGSTGAQAFMGFRKYVIERSVSRIYALLNISTIGCCSSELYMDPTLVDARAAIGVIEANRDLILGIKVRINGRHSDLAHDIEVLKKARVAADATGLPIMMHWSDEPALLDILKKGDILTHSFNPPSLNSSNLFGADGAQADKVLPQILALKDRGIWTDGQVFTSHHQWEVSEKALRQGWLPDSFSTDANQPAGTPTSLANAAGFRPEAVSVLTHISCLLLLGVSLEQAIEHVTTNPAKMLNCPEKIGTLEPGVTADVAILDLAQGNFEFRDGTGKPRVGHQQVVPVATVKAGIVVCCAPDTAALSRSIA